MDSVLNLVSLLFAWLVESDVGAWLLQFVAVVVVIAVMSAASYLVSNRLTLDVAQLALSVGLWGAVVGAPMAAVYKGGWWWIGPPVVVLLHAAVIQIYDVEPLKAARRGPLWE